MLALLVCDCENLEQLLPDCDWLALMTDPFFPLQAMTCQHFTDFRRRILVLTSGTFGSLGNSWNIFFTQNLSIPQPMELVLEGQATAKAHWIAKGRRVCNGPVLPKLSRFHSGRFLIDENSPDVGGPFRVY